jgi:hypothetical protein
MDLEQALDRARVHQAAWLEVDNGLAADLAPRLQEALGSGDLLAAADLAAELPADSAFRHRLEQALQDFNLESAEGLVRLLQEHAEHRR